MFKSIFLSTGLFLAIAIASSFSSFANAETLNCTPITSLPITINEQGVYCLQQKQNVRLESGNAISIETNNVTIDLNGYTIRNNFPGNTAKGIKGIARKFVRIRNGVIRGFLIGVSLTGSPHSSIGHKIEDLYVDQCRYIGIQISGSNMMIRNNWIMDTGTNDPYRLREITMAFGIYNSYGASNRIIDNDITNITQGLLDTNLGIYVGPSARDVLVINNRISKVTRGILLGDSTTLKYRDNITTGVTLSEYEGGRDIGNNE